MQWSYNIVLQNGALKCVKNYYRCLKSEGMNI